MAKPNILEVILKTINDVKQKNQQKGACQQGSWAGLFRWAECLSATETQGPSSNPLGSLRQQWT